MILPLALAAALAGGSVTVPTNTSVTLVVVPPPRARVPAGAFVMGAAPDELKAARASCEAELRGSGALLADLPSRCGSRFDADGPEGEVFLPAFDIDRTEVTIGAYAACVKDGGCRRSLDLSLLGDPQAPLERVTWDEAAVYCRARGGRLPTEAEWEKAARGPTRRPWPWGTQWLDGRANHGRAERIGPPFGAQPAHEPLDGRDGFPTAAPVGSYPAGASPYGALDLAGNVAEWTSTHFAREPPQTGARIAPLGPVQGTERTIRGGSYRTPPSELRVTRRLGLAPGERQAGVGFRCVYGVPRAG